MIKNLRPLLLILLVSINFTCSNNQGKKPVADKGKIDLENWDISQKGPIVLDGEWEFHWNQLLPPLTQKEGRVNYIKTPGDWYNYKFRDQSLPRSGYATYRLKVVNNSINNNIAIYTQDIGSSFDLYINENKIDSTGKLGTNSASNAAWIQPGVHIFNNESEEIEITLHIANFHYSHGGILKSIYFGTQKDILKLKNNNLDYEYFLLGCILIIIIYYLSLFLQRKDNKAFLYFSLFCFLVAIITNLSGQKYLFYKFISTKWEVMVKVLSSSIYISIPVFGLYIQSLYPKNFSKKVLIIFSAISFVFLLMALILPARIHMNFISYFQYIIFLGCIYVYYVLINSVKIVKNAWLFLFGFALITIALINDIFNMNLDTNREFLIPLGSLAFIISQTLILANRVTKKISEIENLTKDLTQENRNLEKQVRDQSGELDAAMDQLQVMYTAITEKNKNLETVQEDSIVDRNMAAYVQTNFLPKAAPRTNAWDISFYFKPLSEVSNNFYDFYIIDKRFHGLGLFEVSGHGISSGLATIIAKTTVFRNFIQNTNSSLDKVLSAINSQLKNAVKNVDHRIRGVLLKFASKNWINCINVGNPDILIRSKSIIFPIRNVNKGSESAPSNEESSDASQKSKYEEISFKVETDDYILMYTDSLIESDNSNGEKYGKDRLIEAFRNAPFGSAERVRDYVVENFYKFIESEYNQKDDLTIIVLKKL